MGRRRAAGTFTQALSASPGPVFSNDLNAHVLNSRIAPNALIIPSEHTEPGFTPGWALTPYSYPVQQFLVVSTANTLNHVTLSISTEVPSTKGAMDYFCIIFQC